MIAILLYVGCFALVGLFVALFFRVLKWRVLTMEDELKLESHDVVVMEADLTSLQAVPAEAKLPPAVLLQRRWHTPPEVAKELGQLVDVRALAQPSLALPSALGASPRLRPVTQYVLALPSRSPSHYL